jgi:manganese transport protein
MVPPPPTADAAMPAKDAAEEPARPSLPEMFRTIPVPRGANFWRKLVAFAGPGYLVAVGYMDPGNWATDLAAGSAFGYTLLSVVLLSSLMAMLLQALSAKLGIVTGEDLAQACRSTYSRPVAVALWLLCETAIVACDIAEVVGTAIAFKLLFGLPLVWGVCLTLLDTFIVLMLGRLGFRHFEAFVVALLAIVGGCFLIELIWAKPSLGGIAAGFVPDWRILRDPTMVYIAIGILGATVMPHNLYLHSSIVQTRAFERNETGRRDAIRFAALDSTIALVFALFINAAILILAAATFHASGHGALAEIGEAHRLLAPLLGAGLASTLFAVALLASGQNSTITATLAGQIVMEGFVQLRLPAWLRRLVTRAIAVVPAALVAGIAGDSGTARLLILTQVVLSLQLPFAVIPLVRMTSDRRRMGVFANARWLTALAWTVAAIIVMLNLTLIAGLVMGRA